jgi:hypothetical protein
LGLIVRERLGLDRAETCAQHLSSGLPRASITQSAGVAAPAAEEAPPSSLIR